MTYAENMRRDEVEGRHVQEKNLLSANHRRVLAITLSRIERAVWHLEEQLTREVTPQLALTRFIDEPDMNQKAALLSLIQRLRQEIATFALDYGLEVQEESFLRTTAAEFTLLWCDLEDMRPKQLRGYGPLHPQVDEILNPRVQLLIALTLAINDVAHGKPEAILRWQAQAVDRSGMHE